MSRRRKWIGRIAAIVAAPPALWVLLVTLGPTDWARARLERRVAEATGRRVAIGKLELGLLGDVRLRDLRIMERAADAPEPCFQVDAMRLDLHLLQLLKGESGATEILADGVQFRVTRDADGDFNLADLLQRSPDQPAPAPGTAAADHTACTGLTIRLANGRMTVLDVPTRTRLEFTEVTGHALWTAAGTTVREITGILNQGEFRFEGTYDRSEPTPRFAAQVAARNVSLGVGMEILTYVVPILPGAEATMGGRLDLDLDLHARGATPQALTGTLGGLGSIRLDPIHLQGSAILDEFCRLARIDPEDRTGTFQSDFAVRDRRVHTQETVLTVNRQPIQFSGWTDFDGHVDYRVQSESITTQLSPVAQDLLSELPVKLDELITIHVRGDVGKLDLAVEGEGLLGTKAEERARLKKFGQRLLDKIRR